jgi:GR25 family glycosyltransferase involved in LPS biosynthesis
MNKNKDRWYKISSILNIIEVSFSRIEAIDGFKLVKNNDAKEILKCRPNLLDSIFKCNTFNQEWVYDGNIQNSFPGLNIFGHEGAKGLILSNIKAFQQCIKINNDYIYALNDDNHLSCKEYNSCIENSFYKYDWFCILEDDAIINRTIYNEIQEFVEENNDIDIILLDKRVGGGAAGVLYNSKIIKQVLEDLHPLSDFSIKMEDEYNHATLWDWKLWHYINNNDNIICKILPCIDSGGFDSTIDL